MCATAVEKFKEHRPYVQEYETVVQPTGRVREAGGHVESLGSEVRLSFQQGVVDMCVREVSATSCFDFKIMCRSALLGQRCDRRRSTLSATCR